MHANNHENNNSNVSVIITLLLKNISTKKYIELVVYNIICTCTGSVHETICIFGKEIWKMWNSWSNKSSLNLFSTDDIASFLC